MAHRTSSKRRIVGVMIDGHVLRGVELRRGLRGLRAAAVAEVVIDASARPGEPLDVDALAEGLDALWAAGSFSSRNVAFGVNGRDTTLRPMTIPNAAAADIDGFVRYQLADYLSYGLEDAIIDHQVVSETGDGPERAVEALTIGVPVELVERLGVAVRTAGLRLVAVDAAPTALATTIESTGDADDAVVSVDGTRTTVVLRSGGRPKMVRVLAAGGGDHTARLADELEGMIARVEGHQAGIAGQPSNVGGQERRFAEAAEAVAAAINYDLREHTGNGVDHVIVTGAYAHYESLHHLLASASGTSVTAAAAPAWWPEELAHGLDGFDHYVEPAGLAFAHLEPGSGRFDLMPPSIRIARSEKRELATGVGLAGALAAASIAIASPARAELVEAEDDVAALEADVAELAARVDGLVLLGDLDDARSQQLDAATDALRNDLWWGRILDSIALATPEDSYLISMNLARPLPGDNDDESIATFEGVGANQAAIGRWLDAIDGLEIFDDVWLVQSTSAVLGESDQAAVSFLAQARLTPAARGPRATDASLPIPSIESHEDAS